MDIRKISSDIPFLKNISDIQRQGINFYIGQEFDAEIIKFLSDKQAIINIKGINILAEIESNEILLGRLHLIVKDITENKIFLKVLPNLTPIENAILSHLNLILKDKNILNYIKHAKFDNDIWKMLSFIKYFEDTFSPRDIDSYQTIFQKLINFFNTANFEKSLIKLFYSNIGEKTEEILTKIFHTLNFQNIVNLSTISSYATPMIYLSIPFIINNKHKTLEMKVTEESNSKEGKNNFRFSMIFELDIIGFVLIEMNVFENKIHSLIKIEQEKYKDFIEENIEILNQLLIDIGYTPKIELFVDKNLYQKKQNFLFDIYPAKVDIRA